ncbi:MAG TPA: hypothetical protein VKW06_16290 [Candidatus Angelobacter sp.]|nr:hypothetical protein [Candidatus Angelobacter sp.]
MGSWLHVLCSSLFSALFLTFFCGLSGAQDLHTSEDGTASILSRSAFAHGYRHGYEEGYHFGNIDANMGRRADVKKKHEDGLGYSPKFGTRQSFEEGFHAGLQAGYYDGYAGNDFRAVDAVRALALDLESAPAGPSGDFDHGLGSGYRDGFDHSQPSSVVLFALPASLDFLTVNCSSTHDIFCEGYRRGFALGRADALTLHREDILEASK